MSSDRPGGPAEVVPEGRDPRDGAAEEQSSETGASRAERRMSRRQRRKAEAKKGSLLREVPVLLLVAFVVAVLVKTFFVQAFYIPSGSMEETLHGCKGCNNDRVLVNKIPYWFGEPEPGDIVVFTGPDTWTPEVEVDEPDNWFTGALFWLGRAVGVGPPSEDDFVKRVIATEGQTVECCDSEGRVTVDGRSLEEPYIFENTPIGSRAFGPVTVPEGRLWVMGDHRSESFDSRGHVTDRYMGTIAVDDVIGRAAVIVWPISRFGLLDSPDIQGTEAMAAAFGPAGSLAPAAIGLAGALPVALRRRERRRRHDGFTS